MAANVSFTYLAFNNTVMIDKISPSSWSPVMKGVMNITGSGFGTDQTKLKVYLSNSSGNVYQMKVMSATESMITVGLSGGLPGKYDVNVIKTGFGSAYTNISTSNDFSY